MATKLVDGLQTFPGVASVSRPAQNEAGDLTIVLVTPKSSPASDQTKDLVAGWMVIDVDSHDRAVELAGELSAAPGAGGKPIHEWLEVRPFMAEPPTVTE